MMLAFRVGKFYGKENDHVEGHYPHRHSDFCDRLCFISFACSLTPMLAQDVLQFTLKPLNGLCTVDLSSQPAIEGMSDSR